MGKRWFPLESNPQVMSKYVETWGFPLSEYTFYDVLSTEEWALGMIPSPVVAVLLLFPITPIQENHAAKQATEQEASDIVIDPSVYYMKQKVGNACGTIGLLHALGNCRSFYTLEESSFLARFLKKTVDKTKDEIAVILEEDEELEESHTSAAQEGQSQVRIHSYYIYFV